MPNSQHCFNCTPMKPCKCKGLLGLFGARPFSKFLRYLRRNAQRRRSSRRFRSVHAVFWPLMSMRSDERERATELPGLPLPETETVTELVLQPLPIEPAPLTSAYPKIESTPPPAASSSTTAKPTPPTTSSYANVEPARPPLTSSYTKVEPTRTTPLTPPYVKMATKLKGVEVKKTKEDFEVQKACKNFEKYITEMLLEERKVRDLLDVEELLYCMDQLQSPAFIELVCTFYGELCLDLFSNEVDQLVFEAGCNY